MAIIKSVKGLTPKYGKDCYFSENAAIVGEVTMGDECSVWFNAVVRGDVAPVTMGNRCNVQDGAVVHVTNRVGPTIMEDDVTIGHNATVHACTLRRGCLIGMGSTVLDNAEVGVGAVVAAGALVLGGTKIGDHEIWGGVPAKFIKMTRPDQAESYAKHYVEYSKWYLEEDRK
ncbi:MAG: gamma carbonic anhydrase family protein [Prevotella sp.]|nr:gamma carbonic anhydrase family protein [Prevotella sp.]MBR1525976.1 gamma carbonic anhydrase family protein [Prevotella sp.]